MPSSIIGSRFVNLTEHTVTVFAYDRKTVIAEFGACGIVARAERIDEVVDHVSIDGETIIEVVRPVFGPVAGLPHPEEMARQDTYYIVSRIAAEAGKANGMDTSRWLIPSNPVRDENGRIIGCKAFGRV